MEDINLVKEEVKQFINSYGYDLCSFNYIKKHKENILEIVVDRDDDISMNDIVDISNKISEFLDNHDFTDDSYNLDVSSLGAEKPLDIAKLDKYLNRYIYVHIINPIDGLNSYEGDLINVNENEITLKYRIKTRYKEVNISKNNIDKCRFAIKF